MAIVDAKVHLDIHAFVDGTGEALRQEELPHPHGVLRGLVTIVPDQVFRSLGETPVRHCGALEAIVAVVPGKVEILAKRVEAWRRVQRTRVGPIRRGDKA
jgi:hypothetical protein